MDKSSDTLTAQSDAVTRFRPQRFIIAIALFLFTSGAIVLWEYGWQQSLLFLIGGLLGVTLYHASFGFAAAYRKLLVRGEVQGIYAQLLLLAIATLLFAPILASGSIAGLTVRGAIAPVGLQGAIGAFLFGIGMQLGGACGCGTLYTLGSGNLSMSLTLFAFSIGAFGSSLTRQWWAGLPATDKPIVLSSSIGWFGAVAVQLILFVLLAVVLRWWSQKTTKNDPPALDNKQPQPQNIQQFFSILLRGPWPLWVGAIIIALLDSLTLILSGQPWRLTWGFALWSAKAATLLGWDSLSSPFWGSESGQRVLSAGILADVSSVMSLGIILGAILAAALAGHWVAKGQWTWPKIISTLLGGFIMGYSAFLAAGCNVNAFLGGIASTSLHGWVWIIFALLGTYIGVRLRPLFHLEN